MRRWAGSLWYLLLWPLFVLQRIRRAIFAAVARWWAHRELWRLLWGLPFLAVIVLSGYVLLAGSFRDEVQISQDYSQAADAALAAQDYAAARVYQEWLIGIRGESEERLFRLAQACFGMGDVERFRDLITRLAPADKPGYADAHLVRAKWALGQKQFDYPTFQEAQTHLLHAIQRQPKHLEARALLGNLYFQIGWWEEASKQLLPVAAELPEQTLNLAKSLALQGKADLAKHYGERALTYYQTHVASSPGDHARRLGWAESTMFLKDYASAERILQEGLLYGDRAEFKAALARVYIAWADSLETTSIESRQRKLELLQQAMYANAGDLAVFDRVMRLLESDQQLAESATSFLISNIASGRAPLLSHLLLGTHYGNEGDSSSAVFHLRRAYEIDPQMYVAANNLAWYMAQSDPPRLDEALTLINTVAPMYANVAAVRDTKGQILAKMGKWEEALVELEAALPGLRLNKQLHSTLAEVYQRLEKQQLSEEHRRIAQQLQAEDAQP